MWWYVRTSPARASIYIVYTVRDIFQHQLRGRMKELLRVTCKGAARGSRRQCSRKTVLSIKASLSLNHQTTKGR